MAAETLEPFWMGGGLLYEALCLIVSGNQVNHFIQQDTIRHFCIHLVQNKAKDMISIVPVLWCSMLVVSS